MQLLTGFLLTLPFQQRFTRLGTGERSVFLITAGASILATIFLQAPVVVHRALFRRHRREETVTLAHRLAVAGICLLGVAIVGVSALVGSVVSGLTAGLVVGGVALVVVAIMWLALPLSARDRRADVDA